LSPGMMAAQVGHALITWALEHGKPPENLVLLQAPNEQAIRDLFMKARALDIPASLFTEPDLGSEATAIAIGPGGRRMLSNLPLLFRTKST
jgi:peptidyl-tRNA hydrolase